MKILARARNEARNAVSTGHETAQWLDLRPSRRAKMPRPMSKSLAVPLTESHYPWSVSYKQCRWNKQRGTSAIRQQQHDQTTKLEESRLGTVRSIREMFTVHERESCRQLFCPLHNIPK